MLRVTGQGEGWCCHRLGDSKGLQQLPLDPYLGRAAGEVVSDGYEQHKHILQAALWERQQNNLRFSPGATRT